MFISPHQCDYLSPFNINGKGSISLGLLPLRLLHLDALSCGLLSMQLMNLSPFDKGNHYDVMLKTWLTIISLPGIMPLQPIMGIRITPACGYVSPYLLFKMNNMLPLQSSSATQPKHRSIAQE
jgi:hypothetical protein